MRTGSTDTLQTMYIFCSSDATMIPDVDHHLFLGFWLQHHNYSTASMDGVSSYFYLSFASEAFILDFFWTFFTSERICSGACAATSTHKTNTQTSRSLLCYFFSSGEPAFFGDTGLGMRNVFPRCFTHGAGTPLSILACFRAPGNLPFLPSPFLLARNDVGTSGHGDEGARGDVSDSNLGLDTTSTNGTFSFLCLSLHEYPGGTGSLIRPNSHLSSQGNRYRRLEAYPTAPDVGDQVRDDYGAVHL